MAPPQEENAAPTMAPPQEENAAPSATTQSAARLEVELLGSAAEQGQGGSAPTAMSPVPAPSPPPSTPVTKTPMVRTPPPPPGSVAPYVSVSCAASGGPMVVGAAMTTPTTTTPFFFPSLQPTPNSSPLVFQHSFTLTLETALSHRGVQYSSVSPAGLRAIANHPTEPPAPSKRNEAPCLFFASAATPQPSTFEWPPPGAEKSRVVPRAPAKAPKTFRAGHRRCGRFSTADDSPLSPPRSSPPPSLPPSPDGEDALCDHAQHLANELGAKAKVREPGISVDEALVVSMRQRTTKASLGLIERSAGSPLPVEEAQNLAIDPAECKEAQNLAIGALGVMRREPGMSVDEALASSVFALQQRAQTTAALGLLEIGGDWPLPVMATHVTPPLAPSLAPTHLTPPPPMQLSADESLPPAQQPVDDEPDSVMETPAPYGPARRAPRDTARMTASNGPYAHPLSLPQRMAHRMRPRRDPFPGSPLRPPMMSTPPPSLPPSPSGPGGEDDASGGVASSKPGSLEVLASVTMASPWFSIGAIPPPPPLSSIDVPPLRALPVIGAETSRMAELKWQVVVAAAAKDEQEAPTDIGTAWTQDWHKHEKVTEQLVADRLQYATQLEQIQQSGVKLVSYDTLGPKYTTHLLDQGVLPMPKVVAATRAARAAAIEEVQLALASAGAEPERVANEVVQLAVASATNQAVLAESEHNQAVQEVEWAAREAAKIVLSEQERGSPLRPPISTPPPSLPPSPSGPGCEDDASGGVASPELGLREAPAAPWLSIGMSAGSALQPAHVGWFGAAADRMAALTLQVELAAGRQPPGDWASAGVQDWHQHQLVTQFLETDRLLPFELLHQKYALHLLAQGVLPMPKAVHARAKRAAEARAAEEARGNVEALRVELEVVQNAPIAALQDWSAGLAVEQEEEPALDVFAPISSSTAQEPPARDETPLPGDANRKRKLDLDNAGSPPPPPQLRPLVQVASPARRGLMFPFVL